MARHDSESSASDGEGYTETNVLLGYASKNGHEDTISRLGGRADWLEVPPSAAMARCKSCKGLMVLLLQLNGELPTRFPGHERRLYVFACRQRMCRRKDGSIRALRGVRVTATIQSAVAEGAGEEEEKAATEEPKASTNLGEMLFGAKTLGSSGLANPFASPTPTPASIASTPFSSVASAPATRDVKPVEAPKPSTDESIRSLPRTFAETLSLNNPQSQSGASPAPEPWPPEEELPSPYPISYLAEADYEVLDPTPLPVTRNMAGVDMDDPSAGPGGGGKEDRKVFESSMDSDFQKFADRLAQNPEQMIRYEFGGQPLLYSRKDAVGQLLGGGGGKGMARCGNCGSKRTFEVQLTPNAIAELEADEISLEGMDWGTIIVGVCESDCQVRGERAGYLEEWVGVQWEELTARK